MPSRPQPEEAAGHFWNYINQVQSDDVIAVLNSQLQAFDAWADAVSEDQSLHRYEAGKWSIREVLNHIGDTERVFTFRAWWFARGLEGSLPGFDQDIAAAHAGAHHIPWASHKDEFRRVRLATLSLVETMPAAAWDRKGIASGTTLSTRALLFATAGHFEHHRRILTDRYGV